MPQSKWISAGAQAIGLAHLEEGLALEDRCLTVQLRDGLILIVSDGAGSAINAEEGAELALAAASESLLAAGETAWSDPEGSSQQLLETLRQLIKARTLEQPALQARDFAATLSVWRLWEDGRALAMSVGDSPLICCASAEGEEQKKLQAATPADCGEHAGETEFACLAASMHWRRFVECQFAAAISDGLSPLLMKEGKPFEPAWRTIEGWCRNEESSTDTELSPDGTRRARLAGMLKQGQETGRVDDDLSIVAAVRR